MIHMIIMLNMVITETIAIIDTMFIKVNVFIIYRIAKIEEDGCALSQGPCVHKNSRK